MAKKPDESSGGKRKQGGFPDFASLLADMKLPPFGDMGAILRANQRNMEVFAAANRVALETSQAYVKRHMEIVQDGLAKLTELMQTFTESGEPKTKMAKQLGLLKEAREGTIASMEELGALIQKSNREVVRLLSERFAQAIDELESVIAKTGHHAP